MDSEPQNLPTFYTGAHVLITGATGFMGKVLIEKLLRCCPQVSKLYLLIRCKKGQEPGERLKVLFNDAIFKQLSVEIPNFLQKVCVIPGDCGLPSLGLDQEHVTIIQENINVIFHGAATVRMDENLKTAYSINVGGVRELLHICQQMKNLKAFVHLSTMYANWSESCIKEKFYEPPSCTPRLEQMTQLLTPEELDILTPGLIETWPNTYTMTKAIGEHLIKQEQGRLPVCVFRPAIVFPTYKEPISGWIDNYYGPVGMTVAAWLGVLRVFWADGNQTSSFVPVDMAVNAMLILARNTHLAFSSGDETIKIYNYDSGRDNPIKWGDYKDQVIANTKVPTIKAMWYYSCIFTKRYYIFWILSLLLHYFPAYVIDGIASLTGKKPQMVKTYDRITKSNVALARFTLRTYKFDNNNVRQLVQNTSLEDQQVFYIDVKVLDWKKYFNDMIFGCRLYLLKDPLETLPQALVKWRRLYWLHNATKFLLFCGFAFLCYILHLKLRVYSFF